MNYNPEYLKNQSMLKNCKSMYSFIAIAYFISCVPFAFISLYVMITILIVDISALLLFLDVVFKLATFILGFSSIYCHKSLYGYYAVGVGLLDFVICGTVSFLQFLEDINVILLLVYIILCVLTFYTNQKYDYLEQQEGFPYFSERFEEQKAMKGRDIYAERYEEIKKASSGKSDMDDL